MNEKKIDRTFCDLRLSARTDSDRGKQYD